MVYKCPTFFSSMSENICQPRRFFLNTRNGRVFRSIDRRCGFTLGQKKMTRILGASMRSWRWIGSVLPRTKGPSRSFSRGTSDPPSPTCDIVFSVNTVDTYLLDLRLSPPSPWKVPVDVIVADDTLYKSFDDMNWNEFAGCDDPFLTTAQNTRLFRERNQIPLANTIGSQPVALWRR